LINIKMLGTLFVLATSAIGGEAKKLWATSAADPDNIIMTAYPLGNGKLGGKTYVDDASIRHGTTDGNTPSYASGDGGARRCDYE
jgi:hypothetical protein